MPLVIIYIYGWGPLTTTGDDFYWWQSKIWAENIDICSICFLHSHLMAGFQPFWFFCVCNLFFPGPHILPFFLGFWYYSQKKLFAVEPTRCTIWIVERWATPEWERTPFPSAWCILPAQMILAPSVYQILLILYMQCCFVKGGKWWTSVNWVFTF